MNNEVKDILEKAYKQGRLDGYVIDTGNWENVNAEVAARLAERIKKHPILWKLFFMVAYFAINSTPLMKG